MAKYEDCPNCHRRWDTSEGPRNAISPVIRVGDLLKCPVCGFEFKVVDKA